MQRYSVFSLLGNALTGNRNWERAWRDPDPKPEYDVIVIGGGGHGLSTAYYLAKEHGVRNVALLEKGYFGGGNVGRNTTIVRSNYMIPGNTEFYELSLKLWEELSRDLNYNVMFSQRGQVSLATSPAQMEAYSRRGNVMRMNGIDAELLDREQLMKLLPYLDYSPSARYRLHGGMIQQRAGTARHDAVAWGYARGASNQGVDLIQQCEVLGFLREGDRIVGVETNKGPIRAKKVAMAVAGSTTTLAEKAGLELPIESHLLQAFVTEPLKPMIHHVISFATAHFYISQSDKGGLVLGGDLDGYNSYAQRGNLPVVDEVLTIAKALIPSLSRLRVLRHWAGVMDMSMDGSPIIDISPIPGLYINCGWCYGGFKATPASGFTFAHTIARDEPHPCNAKLRLDRFRRGYQIDERGAGPVPGWH